MAQVVIGNPVLNSPYAEPTRHFKFDDEGITIRDRLRVLFPNDPQNYYRERDILPTDDIARLCQAKLVVTNFHSFKLRERGDAARLTKELQGALHSLYGNYEKAYRLWEKNAEAQAKGQTPPVFIVVCNNTNVSKLVFDYIAGWEKLVADGQTVIDTDSWEQKMAQTLEDMPEVVCYVKNQNVGFTIPYTMNGEEKQYYPDFIARIDDGRGRNDLLSLIVEVTGEKKKDKAAKAETAGKLWVPAVNNHGGFGRWGFIEIDDPWDGQNAIRKSLKLPGGSNG